MRDFLEDNLGWLIVAAVIGMMSLLIWVAVVDQRRWDQFAVAHRCVKVGEISGFKKGWACDDGVTYWR